MNRRKHMNIVPVAALLRALVAALFLGAAGLSYVYFKNQMQTTGDQIHEMEGQLNRLVTQDNIVRAQIDRLSSQAYLQRRLAEGFIKLIPIQDDRIVRLHPGTKTGPATVDDPDGLQPVSNRIIAQ